MNFPRFLLNGWPWSQFYTGFTLIKVMSGVMVSLKTELLWMFWNNCSDYAASFILFVILRFRV